MDPLGWFRWTRARVTRPDACADVLLARDELLATIVEGMSPFRPWNKERVMDMRRLNQTIA